MWRQLDARKIDATQTLYEIFYYEEPAVTAGQLRRGLLETRLPSWSVEERAAALLAVADLISDQVTFFAPGKRGLDDHHSHDVQLIPALRAAAAEQ